MFKPRRICKSPAQDEIISSIRGNPLTYEEISEKTGRSGDNIAQLMSKLKRNEKAYNVRLKLATSSRTYSFHPDELIGKLAGKTIAFVSGEEILLGKRIIRDMPAELDDPQMKKSISQRLIPLLPEDAAEVVRDYMCFHVVCRYPFDIEEHEVEIVNPGGEFAHENFPGTKYETDFVLPLGAPVLAVKKGEVVASMCHYNRHFSPTEIKDLSKVERSILIGRYTNFVDIKHEDKIFTEYVHLAKEEVVSKGDYVEEGEMIGRVGLIGVTNVINLHSNAYKIENEKHTSIPVKFIE
ncbi:MAG: peptidoglycan DD-metalloendopeptidase family protein [Candidatus Aenigmarchaeota archaeon]|nr:peptidoglycan DD-metalloendopeptidase family protein [Candidatus Aenigmarchaeota archaeon]